MKIIKNPWFVTVAGGIIAGIIIYLINPSYLFSFIKWWPSGWLTLIAVLFAIILISNKKLRALILARKFGPKSRGKLLISGNKVYLILNNTRRWIKNQDTLYELGYDFDQVQRTDRKELDKYREEKPISIYFWE